MSSNVLSCPLMSSNVLPPSGQMHSVLAFQWKPGVRQHHCDSCGHINLCRFRTSPFQYTSGTSCYVCVCVCMCVYVCVHTYIPYRVARKMDGIQFGELPVQIEFTILMTSSPLVLLTNIKKIWLSNAKAPTRQH